MNRKEWRDNFTYYKHILYAAYAAEHWHMYIYRQLRPPQDPLTHPIWVRAGLPNYVEHIQQRTENPATNPFFIDKCAMHGCNAPAMHRYHGKIYCHSCATQMQRFSIRFQAFRLVTVADNLSQIIMLGESSGEGKEV